MKEDLFTSATLHNDIVIVWTNKNFLCNVMMHDIISVLLVAQYFRITVVREISCRCTRFNQPISPAYHGISNEISSSARGSGRALRGMGRAHIVLTETLHPPQLRTTP